MKKFFIYEDEAKKKGGECMEFWLDLLLAIFLTGLCCFIPVRKMEDESDFDSTIVEFDV